MNDARTHGRTPAYYVGNPLTFIGDGADARWPSHSSWLDYELEVAALITRPVSPAATDDEVPRRAARSLLSSRP